MSKQKASAIAFLIFVGLMAGIYYLEKTTCNKPGSAAEKINWAGHNCPR